MNESADKRCWSVLHLKNSKQMGHNVAARPIRTQPSGSVRSAFQTNIRPNVVLVCFFKAPFWIFFRLFDPRRNLCAIEFPCGLLRNKRLHS